MIDAGDSLVNLKWFKNHPENHYLKIAILWASVAAASLNDLKIQLKVGHKVGHTTLTEKFKPAKIEN